MVYPGDKKCALTANFAGENRKGPKGAERSRREPKARWQTEMVTGTCKEVHHNNCACDQ